MSITKIIPGGISMIKESLATKSDFETASEVSEDEASTVRSYDDECALLKVFVDPSFPDDEYKNDKFDVIGRKTTLFSSIAFELWKDGAKIADLNDNTYGTFYPVGTWSTADGYTPNQAKQSGYQGDWLTVYNLHGAGCYNVVKVLTIGFSDIRRTIGCTYQLMLYSNDEADGTVKFEAIQKGYIISEFIDYTGIDWTRHFRIPGFFGLPERQSQQNWFVNRIREEEQIQDSIRKVYLFEPYFLPKCIQPEMDEVLLSNYIFFTDYNLSNAYDLRKIQVRWNGDENVNYFEESTVESPTFKFIELKTNRLKRNVQ